MTIWPMQIASANWSFWGLSVVPRCKPSVVSLYDSFLLVGSNNLSELQSMEVRCLRNQAVKALFF